jgi:flagellar basal body rod protein FlgG
MKVQEHRQTLYANNLANVNTTGFKHDLAVITQRQVESRETPGSFRFAHRVLDDLPGGINIRQPFQNFSQGPIESTGRAFDVAIAGKGFFAVGDGDTTRYTRDGEFTRNAVGQLALASGGGRWRVLDETGDPITFAETGGPVSIGENGTVRQGSTVVGRIGMYEPDDPQSLRKVGENLFEPKGTEMQASQGTLRAESREDSNFDMMPGLAEMLEATRAYQLNATMIQLQDQLSGRVIELGRPT